MNKTVHILANIAEWQMTLFSPNGGRKLKSKLSFFQNHS